MGRMGGRTGGRALGPDARMSFTPRLQVRQYATQQPGKAGIDVRPAQRYEPLHPIGTRVGQAGVAQDSEVMAERRLGDRHLKPATRELRAVP